ncbi:MAG: hypothetical protein WCX61_01960 [Candidatus Peribacteraceae bacterium]
MNKIPLLLCALFLLSGCAQQPISDAEKEFNESGQAKAIEREEDLWQYYDDVNGGFSFQYPYSVSLNGEDEGQMQLSVLVEPIDSFEGAMGYNKETSLKNLEALKRGNYGESVDFALEESKKVVRVEDAYAQQFMVLGRFDVCDITFERKLYFFHNSNLIVITLSAPQEAVVQSAPEYFTRDPENCGESLIREFEKQADFYQMLAQGEGAEPAQEWFDTFDAIVNTITFVDTPDISALLQGMWTSLDDAQYQMEFVGETKKDFYDNEENASGTFALTDESPLAEEGTEGPYLIVDEDDEQFVYAIVDVSDTELTLMYLPRGNILRFGR